MLAKMRMWHHRRWSVGERTLTCPFMEGFDVFGYRCQEMERVAQTLRKGLDVGGVSGTFSARSVPFVVSIGSGAPPERQTEADGCPKFYD